ncbi:MAG: hypothetical protein AB7I01_22620 [Gammaproteobacteria bacterium]
MKSALQGAVTLLWLSGANADGFDLSGDLALEVRGFPQAARDPAQGDASVALALRPELYRAWNDEADSVLFSPFARLDQNDRRRTHVDVRELTYVHAAPEWELRVGARQVFWGVAESNHLVDVINQFDLVENLDGEDKFGQPMVNVAWKQPWGTVDAFVLTGFRERSFPGRDGRLRTALPVDVDRPRYESPAGPRHVDYALRYAHTLGPVDFGIAHFHGTSREPRLVVAPNRRGAPSLRPFYDLIDQTSLDVLAVVDSCALKLEALRRAGMGETFAALVGGFEYTWVGVAESPLDIGLLGEYHYDERGDRATTPFNHDVFVGSRLGFNDAADSQLLAGVVVDTHGGGEFVNVEARRRFGERWRLELELRMFLDVPPSDLLYGFARDDYLQLELARFF